MSIYSPRSAGAEESKEEERGGKSNRGNECVFVRERKKGLTLYSEREKSQIEEMRERDITLYSERQRVFLAREC